MPHEHQHRGAHPSHPTDEHGQDSCGYKLGEFAAKHMAGIESGLQVVLDAANLGHTVLGTKAMTSVTKAIHKTGIPQWTPAMPRRGSLKVTQEKQKEETLKVVYFPSCINQTMGLAKGAPVKNTVIEEMSELLHKAGYEIIYPKNMKGD